MGHLSNTRELKEDVLFRSSEPLTGSKWEPKAVTYLNRVYRTLASGASEFLPEFVEDWWWLRGADSINIQPAYTSPIQVTQGSIDIIIYDPPSFSVVGWRLLIPGSPDIPLIATHTGGLGPAALDQQWTGDTSLAIDAMFMKTTYDLNVEVQVIMSPITIFHAPGQISGLTPERMDELFPVAQLAPGAPQAFSLENDNQIRFSHGGSSEDGREIRAEYRYRPKVVDLADSVNSIPLVPTQWMHLLSDMALTYLLIDKNDDRSNAVALAARTGLAAMFKDNRRRLAKIDTTAGKIMPRQGQLQRNIGKSWPSQ